MALISKGIIESYGPPPGERRMLYSINQGFLNGENISQDVIIYGGNGQQTKYNIYEREINEVIGKPQIGKVNKSDPTFWSATGNFIGGMKDSVVDTVSGIGNMLFHPIQTAQGIGNALAHPLVTGEAIWDTVSTTFVNDVINGDANTRARFAGRAIGEIGLAVVGTKGLDKVSKIDKVVDATRAVKATMGRISDDVVRVLSNEGGYIRFGKAADDVGDVVAKKPIVVGENMQRVKQYADEIGGHAYNPWKNDPFDFDLGMKRNQRWINDMKKEGREIIDIGPDFSRRSLGREPSSFYNMERTQLKGYENYRKVFERDGRLSGGVPGLDW